MLCFSMNRFMSSKYWREQFDHDGRMKPSPHYERVVDVMEELIKFTLLTRDCAGYLTDAARIDREARALGREAAFRLREALLMPDKVHEVCGIFAVVNREGGIETDLLGVLAQQARRCRGWCRPRSVHPS